MKKITKKQLITDITNSKNIYFIASSTSKKSIEDIQTIINNANDEQIHSDKRTVQTINSYRLVTKLSDNSTSSYYFENKTLTIYKDNNIYYLCDGYFTVIYKVTA